MNNPEKTAEAFFEFEGLSLSHRRCGNHDRDEVVSLYCGRMLPQIVFNG